MLNSLLLAIFLLPYLPKSFYACNSSISFNEEKNLSLIFLLIIFFQQNSFFITTCLDINFTVLKTLELFRNLKKKKKQIPNLKYKPLNTFIFIATLSF